MIKEKNINQQHVAKVNHVSTGKAFVHAHAVSGVL